MLRDLFSTATVPGAEGTERAGYGAEDNTSREPEAVLGAIDDFGWNSEFLMNIGDRKGAILDKALRKRQPQVGTQWQFLLAA